MSDETKKAEEREVTMVRLEPVIVRIPRYCPECGTDLFDKRTEIVLLDERQVIEDDNVEEFGSDEEQREHGRLKISCSKCKTTIASTIDE